MTPAWHFDGQSATRHAVTVQPTSDGFLLAGDGVASGPHRWSDVIAQDGTGGRSVYGLKGAPGWRLIFDGPPPADFAVHLPLPARYGRWIDRLGLPRAAALFAVVAAGVVFVVLSVPGWLAPLVPRSVENRLGDAMVGDLGGRLCETPEGTAALSALAARLGAGEAGVRSIGVVHVPIVNAAALPGGRILIFDGLLRQAKSPDEVAGVLAHEIGHVGHRDTMVALLRQLGLSVVLGGFNGEVGGALNSLLSTTYSREAESAADSYAIDALRSAAIAPDATAAFFDRLGGGKEGEQVERAMGWMSSHPVSAERKAAFLRSRQAGVAHRPAMSAADWAALRGMCAADADVKESSDLAW